MKKIAIILFLIPFLVGSCKNRNNNAEADQATAAGTSENIAATTSEKSQKSAEDLSGNVIFLSASEFARLITDIDNPKGFQYKGTTPCVVDFYADWCAPCQSLNPILKRLAKEYKGKLIIYKVNTDKAQEVCSAFEIQSIPTLLFFKRNTQPRRVVGAPFEKDLKATIEQFLNE